MIKLELRQNTWGFSISEEARNHFIKIGTAEKFANISSSKLEQLTFKAKRMEEVFISDALRPRVLFSDMLKQNRLKFVTATSGSAQLKLPNANGKRFRIDPVNIDSDAQYLTLQVFNHFQFATNGATFHVAKSLVKAQLYAALR